MTKMVADIERETLLERGLEKLHTLGQNIKTMRPPEATERNWDAEDELQHWVGAYVRNIAINYGTIIRSRHIGPIEKLFKDGTPAAVVGAGPSLDKNAKNLRYFPGIIIASDRAAKSLTAQDIAPDIVVAVDPRPYHIAKMLDYPENKEQLLIASVCIHPDVVKAWKGRLMFMSHMNPGTQFFDHVLPEVFPDMPGLYVMGNVGNMCVQLAAYMGCGKIVLVGQDYGYTGGKMHADDWFRTPAGWMREEKNHAADLARRTGKLIVDGIETYAPYVSYRKSLMNLVEEWRLSVVNATEGGILTGLPREKLSNLVKSIKNNKAHEARTLLKQATGGIYGSNSQPAARAG